MGPGRTGGRDQAGEHGARHLACLAGRVVERGVACRPRLGLAGGGRNPPGAGEEDARAHGQMRSHLGQGRAWQQSPASPHARAHGVSPRTLSRGLEEVAGLDRARHFLCLAASLRLHWFLFPPPHRSPRTQGRHPLPRPGPRCTTASLFLPFVVHDRARSCSVHPLKKKKKLILLLQVLSGRSDDHQHAPLSLTRSIKPNFLAK